MLTALTIQNIVLIERLTVPFSTGLTALTGETGAGKSILLDSLGLALGGRADSGLVRRGARRASVTAEFEIGPAHPAHGFLDEHGLDFPDGELLVLRRSLNADGRSRAHINDQPVSVGLLKSLGDMLVEVHGQFDTHGLLDPRTHVDVLDAFAGVDGDARTVSQTWHIWRTALKTLKDARRQAEEARREEESLRLALEEFDAINPEEGEEERLVEERTFLMNREKIATAINTAMASVSGDKGAEAGVFKAQKALERVVEQSGGRFEAVLEGLDRAAAELSEAMSALEAVGSEMNLDSRELERIEERLFALRDMSRKHRAPVSELATIHTALAQRLALIDTTDTRLEALGDAEATARKAYEDAAAKLALIRREAALRLDQAMAQELPPLKLDKARFATAIETLDDSDWGPSGTDRISFLVATNPGAEPGAINRIASGGELARFMLALKVVLAEGQRQAGAAPTLVFDEVDTGIGGAVADAVGERLSRLSNGAQILVVTHSPQVAARAVNHSKVEKTYDQPTGVAEDGPTPDNDDETGADAGAGNGVTTVVRPLDAIERREEIARMLSGAEVTNAARAAADSLMRLSLNSAARGQNSKTGKPA